MSDSTTDSPTESVPHASLDPVEWHALVAQGRVAGVLHADDVATVLGREDYDGVAAALGARGFRIAQPDEVEGTLADALRVARSGTPVLVNVHIGLTDFRKGAISL